jgi:hypothetical protein
VTLWEANARFDARTRARVPALLVTAVFGAIVAWGAAHHEPWRDEVVPLDIARAATSFADVVAMRVEGHPVGWYVLLWAGWSLVGQTWVLKATSWLLAVGSVYLVNRSRVPWWIRWPFTFSLFPLYQYSVVSRGYGFEMFLLFAFAALFPGRHRHPLALAGVLAALANTEMFGFVMAVAAGAMLLVEWALGDSNWRAPTATATRIAAVAVYAAGLVVAFALAFPTTTHPAHEFRPADLASPVSAAAWGLLQPAAHAATLFVLPYPSLWAWAMFVWLAPQPPLLVFALVTLAGFETFYNLVPGLGAVWHTGNVVLVLLAVVWLQRSGSVATVALPPALGRARSWLGGALAAGAVALFADQAVMAASYLRLDARHDYSANRSFAELLRTDPALAGAAVLGEPDAPLWSLAYYADNRLYLPREGTYRAWGIIAPQRTRGYDLASLLDAARRVRAECACPVVVTLGWPLDAVGTFRIFPDTPVEEQFSVTAAARDEFRAATRLLARLGPTITDENYDVYLLLR